MSCQLYYRHDGQMYKIGTFFNRKAAERFWKSVGVSLYNKLGRVEPVYIETKGRT